MGAPTIELEKIEKHSSFAVSLFVNGRAVKIIINLYIPQDREEIIINAREWFQKGETEIAIILAGKTEVSVLGDLVDIDERFLVVNVWDLHTSRIEKIPIEGIHRIYSINETI